MPMSPEAKKFYKPRIHNVEAGFMIGVAVAFWGIQLLLSLTGFGEVISYIIGWFASMIFLVWFSFHHAYKGQNFGKKLLATLASAGIEFIPFINDIPADVAQVIIIIIYSRIEDRKEAAAKAAAAKKAQEDAAVQRARYIAYMNQRNAQIQQQNTYDVNSYRVSDEQAAQLKKDDDAVIAAENAARNDTRPESEQLLDYQDA